MMLSYMQRGNTVQHEPILARVAGGKRKSMLKGPPLPRTPTEYALELFPEQWHASLADLVHHFTEPGRGLRCTLRTAALGNRKRGLIFARKQTGAEAGAEDEYDGNDNANGSVGGGGASGAGAGGNGRSAPVPPPRSRLGARTQSAGEPTYMVPSSRHSGEDLLSKVDAGGYSDVGGNGHAGEGGGRVGGGKRMNSRLGKASVSLDGAGAPAARGKLAAGGGGSNADRRKAPYWEDPLKSPFVDDVARLQPWQKFGKAKLMALRALDRNRKGSFVVRSNAEVFGTLSIVCDGGKLYNAHIVLDDGGLRLKRSAESFFSLSELIQFYTNPDQTELPQHLTLDGDDYE